MPTRHKGEIKRRVEGARNSYLPAAHGVHTVASLPENEPSGHGSQESSVALNTVPARHVDSHRSRAGGVLPTHSIATEQAGSTQEGGH